MKIRRNYNYKWNFSLLKSKLELYVSSSKIVDSYFYDILNKKWRTLCFPFGIFILIYFSKDKLK